MPLERKKIGPKRLLQALFVVAVFLAFELNVFFLKHALWVPPTNALVTLHLVLWFLCGLPAVREYYEFIDGSGGGARKLGTFAWLAIAVSLCCVCVSVGLV